MGLSEAQVKAALMYYVYDGTDYYDVIASIDTDDAKYVIDNRSILSAISSLFIFKESAG
jgi:hypothetical protein